MSNRTLTVVIPDYEAEDDEAQMHLPGKYQVCNRCQGHGRHTNPAIDGNGITQEEMRELGEDFQEEYMNGVYDITCTECHGKGLVVVPCYVSCTERQRTAWNEYQEGMAYDEAERAAERRAGC